MEGTRTVGVRGWREQGQWVVRGWREQGQWEIGGGGSKDSG